MKATDFSVSKVFVHDGLSYVVIAEHCDRLHPNWAPEREVSFALNEIIHELFPDELFECQEGVFESPLSARKLLRKLQASGFVYNPVLDEIKNDFLEQFA
jgi:hypothetical protein